MGELKHTSEPWMVVPDESTVYVTYIDGHETEILDCWTAGRIDAGMAKANAARIVACVNACAGMADPAAEIARLTAENEKQGRIIANLNNLLISNEYFFGHWKARAETAEAEAESERVRSDALKLNLDCEEKRRLATERSLKDAEAQLAELRARVRPGVEEIAEKARLALFGEQRILSHDESHKIAHATLAILPPVSEVLTVEEIDDVVGQFIRCDPMTDVWCIPSGEISQMIKAIHKAMGGEE